MNEKNNLNTLVNLVNDISSREEKYQRKYDDVFSSGSGYRYQKDPYYKKLVEEREKEKKEQVDRDRYQHMLNTEGANNSWAYSLDGIAAKDLEEEKRQIGQKLTQDKEQEYALRRSARLRSLRKKYIRERSADIYALGKANEAYLGVGE